MSAESSTPIREEVSTAEAVTVTSSFSDCILAIAAAAAAAADDDGDNGRFDVSGGVVVDVGRNGLDDADIDVGGILLPSNSCSPLVFQNEDGRCFRGLHLFLLLSDAGELKELPVVAVVVVVSY